MSKTVISFADEVRKSADFDAGTSARAICEACDVSPPQIVTDLEHIYRQSRAFKVENLNGSQIKALKAHPDVKEVETEIVHGYEEANSLVTKSSTRMPVMNVEQLVQKEKIGDKLAERLLTATQSEVLKLIVTPVGTEAVNGEKTFASPFGARKVSFSAMIGGEQELSALIAKRFPAIEVINPKLAGNILVAGTADQLIALIADENVQSASENRIHQSPPAQGRV